MYVDLSLSVFVYLCVCLSLSLPLPLSLSVYNKNMWYLKNLLSELLINK